MGDWYLTVPAGWRPVPPATLVSMHPATPHRCAVGADIYAVRIETQGETSRIAFDPVR